MIRRSPISPPEAATRWLRVGASAAPDAEIAADDATPRLLLVFASPDLDFDGVAAGIASAVPAGIPVVGCSAAAGMPANGVAEPTVVVAALGGEGLAASAAGVAVTAPGNLREA